MNIEKVQRKCSAVLEPGEALVAASKAMPRGSVHEVILSAAGGVAAAGVSPELLGAGMIAGQKAGSSQTEEGKAERNAAGVDVGSAVQVLVGVTDRRVVLIALSTLGKAKEILAAVDLSDIAGVAMGKSKLFGQTLAEIVLTLDGGAELGFGVAKVHRKDADSVVAALQK
jgi:hypothetical protein